MKRILSAAAAVASAACLAGPGQVRVTASYSENHCVYGPSGTPYVQRTAEPWYAYPGIGVVLTVSRIGGSNGRIAVKYKTQSSTATLLKDFDYVKDVLEWEDGDTSDKEIFIGTYANNFTDADWNLFENGLYYPKLMRIKFSTLATGAYSGYAVPYLPSPKTYIDLIDCAVKPSGFIVPGETPDPNAGRIRITRADSLDCCLDGDILHRTSYSEPWVVNAGDTLRLRVSRVGGARGRVAVKYKTQTSTAICGTDFAYEKDVLTWNDGDSSDRYIYISTSHYSTTGCQSKPCSCVWRNGVYMCTACSDYYNCPVSLQMRVKFVKMTQGAYWGCVVPIIEKEKCYMTINYGSTTR